MNLQISSHTWRRTNETVICKRWRSLAFVELLAEENMPNQTHTNGDIGAYVTVDARIHLYGLLDRLRENAIYCDTESVIFI